MAHVSDEPSTSYVESSTVSRVSSTATMATPQPISSALWKCCWKKPSRVSASAVRRVDARKRKKPQ